MTLSRTQLKVLQALSEAGEPLYNGTIAARTGLRWNSEVFSTLKRAGFIEGHPFVLTEAGRASLEQSGSGK